MQRSAQMEVDLDLIAHNLRLVRSVLAQGPFRADGAPPRLAAVVKGNAYGLGSVAVAGELLADGVDLLAVGGLPEALELRRAFPGAPLLVMGHTPTGNLGEAARCGIRTTLFDLAQAEALSQASVALGVTSDVHVKIDTGMNRLGIKPDADTARLIGRMAALPGLRMEGIFTHLALRDRASDLKQFQLFERVLGETRAGGIEFPLRHVCDSIGMLRYPEFRLDLVRAGAIMFGNKPSGAPDGLEVRTPMALRARISRVRPMAAGEGSGYDEDWRAPEGGARVATVPIGYADGYSRRLSHRAEAIVRGRRVPVLGLVMMDQLVLDVTRAPEVAEGDPVLLMGRWGADEVAIAELAGWADTNRNEIISAIGRRVPRVYHKGGRVVAECDYLLDPVVR
ncbi:MAG: alanine racemase [Holophaga sp.]|nr:alanine racemase [Holophaga sp.]